MIGVGPDGPTGSASLGPATLPASGQPATAAEREALAVLVSVQGLGPVTLDALLETFGTGAATLMVAASADGPSRLQAVDAGGRRPPLMPDGLAHAIAAAAGARGAILDRVARLRLQILVAGDEAYPARLRLIDLPPRVLFVRGDPSSLAARRVVAVVGTRRPSEAGRRIAWRIGSALARAGATVVSGLAVGVDGAAHAATLEAGGPTVAYIGGGHGRLFPMAHDRLAEAIVDAGGAILSEYAPDVEPTKGTFPRRNRLISGSADAVVVVEAGARSGALLTASWALEQGRECFLVPGSIEAPMSAGCLGFLRDWPGAARVVAGIPQLLDDLGLPAEAALPAPTPAPAAPSAAVRQASPSATIATLAPADEPVATALVRGAVTVDELVAVTRATVPAVLATLTRLEALGLVRDRYGRYEATGSLAAALAGSPGARRRPARAAMPPAA